MKVMTVDELVFILNKVPSGTRVLFQEADESPLSVANVRIEYVPEFQQNIDDCEIVIEFNGKG